MVIPVTHMENHIEDVSLCSVLTHRNDIKRREILIVITIACVHSVKPDITEMTMSHL